MVGEGFGWLSAVDLQVVATTGGSWWGLRVAECSVAAGGGGQRGLLWLVGGFGWLAAEVGLQGVVEVRRLTAEELKGWLVKASGG